jgi:hypothetical protein
MEADRCADRRGGRNSWGNAAPAVKADQVAELRAKLAHLTQRAREPAAGDMHHPRPARWRRPIPTAPTTGPHRRAARLIRDQLIVVVKLAPASIFTGVRADCARVPMLLPRPAVHGAARSCVHPQQCIHLEGECPAERGVGDCFLTRIARHRIDPFQCIST